MLFSPGKLLAALLSVLLLAGALLPAASAAGLSATYSAPNYYSIATTAYSRMLLFQNGVVPAADQNQKWGLIDAAGAVKVPFQYAELEALGGGLFRVSDTVGGYSSWRDSDAKEGVIDASGACKISMTAADITCYNGILQVSGESDIGLVDLTAYKIGGNNYFRPRDLCQVFDIGCNYVSGTVVVDTSIGYTPN